MPVLDQLGGRLGSGALLAGLRVRLVQRRLSLPPSRTRGRHGADVTEPAAHL